MKTVVPPGSRCSTPQPVPVQVPQDLPNHHRAVLLMDKLGKYRLNNKEIKILLNN